MEFTSLASVSTSSTWVRKNGNLQIQISAAFEPATMLELGTIAGREEEGPPYTSTSTCVARGSSTQARRVDPKTAKAADFRKPSLSGGGVVA